MSQPPEYERQYSFTGYSQANPAALIPGAKIDQELNAAKQTMDAIRANLALIQRDDGALANDSVGVDQMKPEVTLGLNAVEDWVSGEAYVPNNGVWYEGKLYRCLEGHTADADFAVDLADDKWSLLIDITGVVAEESAPAAEAAVGAAVTSGLIAKRMVGTIAALMALSSSAFADGAAVEVMGYHSAIVPGGGGTFVWSDSSSATHNGGTVIKPTDTSGGSPGRWLRVDKGPKDVRWFGAKGDDSTDDRAAIQATIDATSFNDTVYFGGTPSTRYRVTAIAGDSALKIPTTGGLCFRGDSRHGSRIIMAGGNSTSDLFGRLNTSLDFSNNINNIGFVDLGLEATGTSRHAINWLNMSRSYLMRVWVNGFGGAAVYATNSIVVSMFQFHFAGNGEGILQDNGTWTGLNGWGLVGGYIAGSTRRGVDIKFGMTGSLFADMTIEGNALGGVHFQQDSWGISFDGCYFEENRTTSTVTEDIYLGSASRVAAITVTNSYFNGHDYGSPGAASDFYYPIRMGYAAKCKIENIGINTGQKAIKFETANNRDNYIGHVEFWGGAYAPPNQAQPSFNFASGVLQTFVNAGNTIANDFAPLVMTGFSKGRWPYGGWTLSTSGTGTAIRSGSAILGAPALVLNRPSASTASAAQTFPLQVHMRGRFVTVGVPITSLADGSVFRVAVTPDGTSPITASVDRTINNTGSEIVYATVWVPTDSTNLTVEVLTTNTGCNGIIGHVCVYIGCQPWYSPDCDQDWVNSAAPTVGTWAVGDRVWNSAPSAGGTPGWVCTTGGSPGTFKAMANLAA